MVTMPGRLQSMWDKRPPGDSMASESASSSEHFEHCTCMGRLALRYRAVVPAASHPDQA